MNSSSVPLIESLETRRLMATVGPVVSQEFVGTPEHITAVVLTFNAALDAASAQNIDAYRLVRKHREQNDAFIKAPFDDGKVHNSSSRIRLASANYDPAANTVTLVPFQPSFELKRDFTVIEVVGQGKNAVKTADSQPMDGDGNGKAGGNLFLRFKASGRKTLKFKENDGDQVTVNLDGPGKLLYFLPIRGRSSPSVFIREANAASSIVTGTVKRGKHGDGVADIGQLSGTSLAVVPITTDPAFRIRTTST